MKKTTSTTKLFILPFLVVALFFSTTPEKAQALTVTVANPVLPVIDKTLIAVETKRGATDLLHNAYQDVIKMAGDLSMYAIAQATIDMLTINAFNWVKSGLYGNPLFAVMQGASQMSLTDAIAGTFSNQIRQTSNMANFGPGFQNSLANQLSLTSLADQGRKFQSSLQDPYAKLGVSPQELLEDPKKGTWDTHFTALQDNGNPYGVEIKTAEELKKRQNQAVTAQTSQLSQSRGFLNIVDTNNCSYPDGMITDFTGVDESAIRNLQQVYCKTTTPGAIIEEEIADFTKSPTERLNNIDSINKFIAGFIVSFAGRTASGIF